MHGYGHQGPHRLESARRKHVSQGFAYGGSQAVRTCRLLVWEVSKQRRSAGNCAPGRGRTWLHCCVATQSNTFYRAILRQQKGIEWFLPNWRSQRNRLTRVTSSSSSKSFRRIGAVCHSSCSG